MNRQVKVILWIFGSILGAGLILYGIDSYSGGGAQVFMGFLIFCALFVMSFWGKKDKN